MTRWRTPLALTALLLTAALNPTGCKCPSSDPPASSPSVKQQPKNRRIDLSKRRALNLRQARKLDFKGKIAAAQRGGHIAPPVSGTAAHDAQPASAPASQPAP